MQFENSQNVVRVKKLLVVIGVHCIEALGESAYVGNTFLEGLSVESSIDVLQEEASYLKL